MIENTVRRDPVVHFAGLLGGNERYIEEMEANGQHQLVGSTDIPTEITGGTEDDLRALGFTLGDPRPNDPLFRPAILPEGWSKQATGHAMWSKIVDQYGRKRLALFYKAAFYDRRAFTRIQNVEWWAGDLINGTEPLVLDDTWATAEAVRAAVLRWREYAADAVTDPEYWAAQVAAADRVLAALDGGQEGA